MLYMYMCFKWNRKYDAGKYQVIYWTPNVIILVATILVHVETSFLYVHGFLDHPFIQKDSLSTTLVCSHRIRWTLQFAWTAMLLLVIPHTCVPSIWFPGSWLSLLYVSHHTHRAIHAPCPGPALSGACPWPFWEGFSGCTLLRKWSWSQFANTAAVHVCIHWHKNTRRHIVLSAVLVFAPIRVAVIHLLFLSEYLLCKAPWVAVLFRDVSISA